MSIELKRRRIGIVGSAARSDVGPARGQAGFTFVELITVLAIGASLTAIVSASRTISEAEEALAQNMGEYMMVVREAVVQYQQTNFLALSANTAVTGVANPLAPSLIELKAIGMLNPAVPNTGPLGFVPQIALTRITCPGVTCTIQGVVHTPGSVTSPRTGNTPRYDLAIAAMGAMRGTGGVSYQTDPAAVRGTAFNVANPVTGNPGAVLAGATFLSTNFYNQFVRMNDTRDPNLQGNLSVGGNLQITGTSNLQGNTTVGGSLNVAGATTVGGPLQVNNTINATGNINSQGSIGAGNGGGCNRAEMLQDGRIISRSDCLGSLSVSLNPAAGALVVNNAGIDRVRLTGSGVNAGLTLRNAAGVARVNIGDSGLVEVRDGAGANTAVIDGGSGRATVRKIRVTDAVGSGSACAAGDEGDVVQDSAINGSMLMCKQGQWRPLGLLGATENAACAFDASLGQDSTGRAFICRGGTWQRLNDRVTRNVLMGRFLATDGALVPKPVCPAGVQPSIVLVPADSGADYALAPPRNRFEARALDVGAAGWQASLKLVDQNGTAWSSNFAGDPYQFRAIAHTYCDFAA